MAVPLARRLVAYVLALVLGLCLGALGIVLQASRTLIAGHQVPWGLVGALVVSVIVVRSACWYARSRSIGLLVAVGWVAATMVLALTGPGGDILLPSIARSWIYLVGGLIAVLGAVILPLPKQDVVVVAALPAAAALPGAITVDPADPSFSAVPAAATGVEADDR